MQKIRVIHHSKNIGYSGTDRTAQVMCKYLAKDPKFEPFLVYRDDGDHSRLQITQDILGKDHVIEYHWKPGKRGRQPPYLPEEDNLYEILLQIDPDIVHIHKSGYGEWPGFKYMWPRAKWVETNIFGFADKASAWDKHIYISHFIRNSAVNAGNQDGPILYNPIELPKQFYTKYTYRQLLQLPTDGILIGRVGRDDNFDPISLKAFAEIEKLYNNVYYIIVNGFKGWQDTARQLNIRNIRFLDPIINDEQLSQFYSALDVYAHARSDGECCPCNIQEAMIHGLPIVSHYAEPYNGQAEIIGDSGFCVPRNNSDAYAQVLETLITDSHLRTEFGQKARNRAEKEFEASIIVDRLKEIYYAL